MVTVYLHIGLTKVGSTSLSYFLSQNRDTLLSHGYLYPRTGTTWSKGRNHVSLAHTHVVPDKFQENNSNYRPQGT